MIKDLLALIAELEREADQPRPLGSKDECYQREVGTKRHIIDRLKALARRLGDEQDEPQPSNLVRTLKNLQTEMHACVARPDEPPDKTWSWRIDQWVSTIDAILVGETNGPERLERLGRNDWSSSPSNHGGDSAVADHSSDSVVDAPRLGVPQDEQRGTFACPVCGVGTSHGHTDSDIYNWLDAQASRFGYRMHERQWTIRPDDGVARKIEHALKRLRDADMATFRDTPLGRYVIDALCEELPFAREREARRLGAGGPQPTACVFRSYNGEAFCGTHWVGLQHKGNHAGWLCPTAQTVFPYGTDIGTVAGGPQEKEHETRGSVSGDVRGLLEQARDFCLDVRTSDGPGSRLKNKAVALMNAIEQEIKK